MKQDFIERVNREMTSDFPSADLPARDALAAACRILAREGHESGLAGQVTARAEKPDTWWTLEFGYGFEEASAERIVLVDEDLQPLTGRRPNPGVRFHIWMIAFTSGHPYACTVRLRARGDRAAAAHDPYG